MPNWIVADDSSSYIAYSGSWERQVGSSRQWENAIHSTSQAGASATFRWKGSGVQVYGTVPSGSSGTTKSRYVVDGGSATTVERQVRTDAVYGDMFFELRGMSEGEHSITITNIGGGGADFQLDKIEFYPTDDPATETPLPPAAAPVASQPATTTTTTTQPLVTNNPGAGSGNTGSGTTSNGNSNTGTGTTGTTVISTVVDSKGTTSTVTKVTDTNGGTSTAIAIGASTTTDTNVRLITTTNSDSSTVILRVSDGATYTVTEGSTATGGSLHVGGSDLSKGALAGIIVAAMLVMFMFVLLFFLLIRRSRRRRAKLEEPMGDETGPQTGEVRNRNLNPFDVAAQRTSAFFTGIGATKGADPRRAPFSQLPEVHKPSLNTSSNIAQASGHGAYSPTDLSSPSDYSAQGYLHQDTFPPTLHRRRNTSSDMDATTMASWLGSAPAQTYLSASSEVPPPSYQASLGPSSNGSTETTTYETAQHHVASSSKQ
ncbi:hypothetical protein DFP72DRAFT_511198 [Ephemerocybe angulata]|uniref:Uncharacterized protein n=1 Tax=Ephemerocybe angulata TaxID=980116 RepID=A0A8H6HQL8_9AGAR|nr:hypothetical protein DFP72DRAFT_511198 [Tulosesus angulatus]